MRKEKSFLFQILIVFILLLSSCKKEVEIPTGCYTIQINTENGRVTLKEPYVVTTNQDVEFYNCGRADFYAVFSGKPGSIWREYMDPADSTSVGADANLNGNFNVTYQTPGDYTLTVVLTNRMPKDPSNFKQLTMDFNIKVVLPEGK
jgi:hypothetical protein